MAPAIAGNSNKKDDGYDKWAAENDMRTLLEAKAIQKDPKRMANVKRAAKEKLGETKQIQALAGQ